MTAEHESGESDLPLFSAGRLAMATKVSEDGQTYGDDVNPNLIDTVDRVREARICLSGDLKKLEGG